MRKNSGSDFFKIIDNNKVNYSCCKTINES